MTRDEIFRLAKQAGFPVEHANIGSGYMVGWPGPFVSQHLERFAALVAAQTREECAQRCEAANLYSSEYFACLIRALGEIEQ